MRVAVTARGTDRAAMSSLRVACQVSKSYSPNGAEIWPEELALYWPSSCHCSRAVGMPSTFTQGFPHLVNAGGDHLTDLLGVALTLVQAHQQVVASPGGPHISQADYLCRGVLVVNFQLLCDNRVSSDRFPPLHEPARISAVPSDGWNNTDGYPWGPLLSLGIVVQPPTELLWETPGPWQHEFS